MKNLKKVLALLLALTMVLGTVVFAEETVEVVEDVTAVEEVTEEATEDVVVEETTEEEATEEEVVEETVETVAVDGTFTDVEAGSAWEEPINLGVALGLFTGYGDGTFVPEGDITRAEFAAIVIRALGYDAQANGAKGSTMFTDVASSHWASGYINLATAQGIINGYGDGTFGPEDNVTYEQAVKMVVVALGYEPAVSAPYPVGYLTIAQENGLTDNVKGTNGVAINRGQVAIMIYNALDVPVMKQVGYGTLIDFQIQDGYTSAYRLTLLSEKFSVVKLQAIVNKNYDAESTKKNDVVEIDVVNNYMTKFDSYFEGYEYDIYVGDTDIKDYAGKRVMVYVAYDEVEDEGTALYVTDDIKDTDELTLASSQLAALDADDDITTVEYREEANSKKTEKVTVDNDANIYINGYAVDTTVEAALTGVYGEVTLALVNPKETEADYDVVFVTDWDVLIVDSVNKSSGRVIGKDGSTINRIVYNPAEKGVLAILKDANGKEVDWESLEENDIVNIKFYNGTIDVYDCVLTNNTVEGKVDEFVADAADSEYTIAGEAYKVNPYVYDDPTDAFDVDDEGIFYIDICGRICYDDLSSAASGNYAYIVDFDETAGLGSRVEVMMYTYEGELVTVKTASNFKLYEYDVDEDDVVYDPEVDTAEEITELLEEGMLVTYQLNSNGEVYKMTVAAFNDGVVDADYTNIFVTGLADFKEASGALKVTDDDDAVSTVYITDKTVIMAVDADCRDDENYYAIATLADLVDDYEGWAVAVLDVNEDREASCVFVIEETFELESAATPIAIVKSTSTKKNAAGNSSTAYTLLQNSEEKTYVVADGETVDLAVGDVIVPKFTAAGELKGSTEIVYSLVGGEAVENLDDDDEPLYRVNEDVEYVVGAISDITGSKVFYDDDNEAVKLAGANLYLYDSYQKPSLAIEVVDDFGDVYADDQDDNGTNEIYNVNDLEADDAIVLYREFEGKVIDVIVYLYYAD